MQMLLLASWETCTFPIVSNAEFVPQLILKYLSIRKEEKK